jgi:hypothetical protein
MFKKKKAKRVAKQLKKLVKALESLPKGIEVIGLVQGRAND